MGEVVAIARFVLGATVSVLPAFALSIGLGVLIRALALDGLIRRAVEARLALAVVLAAAVGAFSPLCSCTVVPVISGLLLSGVPLAPVMTFWVASPTMDPEMFALTVATLGWPLAIARLSATIVLSLGAGYLTLALTRFGMLSHDVLRRAPAPRPTTATLRPLSVPLLQPAIAGGSGGATPAPAGGRSCCARSEPASSVPARRLIVERLRSVDAYAFARDMGRESWRLGRWLLLAFLLEAFMLRYVPQSTIAGVLGEGSRFAVVLAALVGIPLYLNNVSALPIVSGLLAQGMQPGAAIAFLIAGPVTTVPAMSAVWGVVRAPVFALYVGIALVGAVTLGWVTNMLLTGGSA
jgi:uncharacterized membrane protein YraQ (UPF0718 family)